MRKRSMAAIAAIGLLGSVAQVEAHGGGFGGGGFRGGGAFHGGVRHVMAPHGFPALNQAAITPAAIQAGAFNSAAPQRIRPRDEFVQHDFSQNREFSQNRDFRHDHDGFAGQGVRIGFPGGAVNFAPRPPRRSIPVLYNYYYSAGGGYYSDAASTYNSPASCAGWGWDQTGRIRVWVDNCQG